VARYEWATAAIVGLEQLESNSWDDEFSLCGTHAIADEVLSVTLQLTGPVNQPITSQESNARESVGFLFFCPRQAE
jgi:hypothetical protein